MKIRITLPDGTRVTAKGTPDECAELCGKLGVPPIQPYYVPWYTGPPWWTTDRVTFTAGPTDLSPYTNIDTVTTQ